MNIEGIGIFGIEKKLSLTIGQFAIVLWDNFEKKIHLIRDRMGEKPLYYGFVNGSFTFSSEIKALKKFPNFSNRISKDNLGLFFKYLSIPSPYSISLRPNSFKYLVSSSIIFLFIFILFI